MSTLVEDQLPVPVDSQKLLGSALRTLAIETSGLNALVQALNGPLGDTLAQVVHLIRCARGRVIVTGIGKSGHIGTKMAATFASTGTPAFFVHPSEASHGDLGMITPDDVVLALSWSGESQELAAVITYSRRFNVPLVAFTSSAQSTLGRAADLVMLLPKVEEACPHGLAPTTSTTMQLALGDALAIALLEARGFTALDFRVFHPGGKLGASLKLVRDIMHPVETAPLIASGVPMSEALIAMTAKGFGAVGVVDAGGRLMGIITDGDLRRHMTPDLIHKTVDEVMNPAPKTIRSDLLVASAIDVMNRRSIMAIFVVDDDQLPIGFVHMHDLVRLGVV